MRTLYLLLLSFISVYTTGQTHKTWGKYEISPGAQMNGFITMASDKAGNTYVINSSQASNLYTTYRFYRYDTAGTKVWEYKNDSCFTNCQEKYKQVIPIEGGGALFVGTYENTTGGNPEIRIKRIGLVGNLIWQKNWASPYPGIASIIAKLDNNGKLVVGMTVSGNQTTGDDFAIAKFDTIAGNLMWNLPIPNGNQNGDLVYETLSDIDIDANNDIYGCGFGGNPFLSIARNYFFRVLSNGTLVYKQEAMNSGLTYSVRNLRVINGRIIMLIEDGSHSILENRYAVDGMFNSTSTISRDSAIVTPVGLTYHLGDLFILSNYRYQIPDSTFAGFHWTNNHFMVSKLNINFGNVIWQKSYLEQFDSLAPTHSMSGAAQLIGCASNIYVLSALPPDSTRLSFILTKINMAGILQWYDTSELSYELGRISSDTMCNIFAGRTFQQYSLLEKYGQVVISDLDDDIKGEELKFYPNPSSGKVSIALGNSSYRGICTYSVRNSLGAIILQNNTKSDQFQIDLSASQDGIYYVSFQFEDGWGKHIKLLKISNK